MKRKQLRLGAYFPILFIFTVAATVLRTLASLKSLDAKIGYYTDKPLITVANIFAAVGVITLFTYIIRKSSKDKLAARYDVASTYIPAGAVSVALLFIAYRFGAMFIESLEKFHGSSDSIRYYLMLGVILSALLSIGGFFTTVLTSKREDTVRAAFGIATVIFLALYSSYLYFDNSLPLNSPVKLTEHMALLFSAVFFIYEVRISLGRDMWRAYITFGMIATLTTAYSAIPELIYYIVKGETMLGSVEELMLTLTLLIFIVSRLLLTAKLRNDKKSELASVIHEMTASKREELARARANKTNVENPVIGETEKESTR